MATAVAGRVARVSAPAEIEDTLAALWREAGRDRPLTRALMANLVVFRACGAAEPIDLTAPIAGLPVDDVAARHPSRVIVVHHARGHAAAAAKVEASVAIITAGTPDAPIGIEEIAVRSACPDESLPSIVRRLALGDLPTSIWWTDDLSADTPRAALVAMGRQLVYDSRGWRDLRVGIRTVVAMLDQARGPDLADLNWRRLAPMRQALMQAASPAYHGIPPRARHVRIYHRPGDGALAWLLAGWLASRLGWRTGALPLAVEEARHGGDQLSISFGSETDVDVTATMNGHRVLVKSHNGAAPLIVSVPRRGEAEAVAAELQSLGRDESHHDAVAALAAIFAAAA